MCIGKVAIFDHETNDFVGLTDAYVATLRVQFVADERRESATDIALKRQVSFSRQRYARKCRQRES